MDKKGLVLVIAVFSLVIIDVARSTHFRGGTMSWRAREDGQVDVTYRLAWRADSDPVEGDHNCTFARVAANALIEGDRGQGITLRYPDIPNNVTYPTHKMPYHCTARHESSDYPTNLERSWVMGDNTMVLAPPPDGRRQYEIVWKSCCWVRTIVNYAIPRKWLFVMSVDLDPREDIGRVNTPPVTSGLPLQRVSKGCKIAWLRIPTYDADGDHVECRWIRSGECTANCNEEVVWPRTIFQIVNRNGVCRLLIRPATAQVGFYAVAIMIEDFADGRVLSKVPFQFMLEITGDETCFAPTLVNPPLGACWVIPVGEPFTFNLTARTTEDRRIHDITTTNTMGMHSSPLLPVPGSTTDYYVTMTWTPTEDDVGVNLFCFQPEDPNGLQGRQRCIDIMVGDQKVPEPLGEISNPPAGRSVLNSTTAFEIIFDTEVTWPSADSEIRLLLTDDMSEVYTVKVEPDSSSGNVLISYNAILFSIPEGLLVNGANYTLDLPAGLARGYGSCQPWSKAASWHFFVGAGARGDRHLPKVTTEGFLQNPQCFGTHMQIFVPKTMVPYQDPTMMHLNEPTCVGSPHNGTHLVMRTDYQYCGTHIESVPNQRKSIISNTIRIPSLTLPGYPYATRRNVTLINVVCEMNNDRITFVQFDADIPAIVHNRTGSGAFNFSLRMFPDDSFTPRSQFKYDDYPVNVNLTQRLYFESKALIDSSLPLEMFLRSCEATPTPNPMDRLYYRFIEDGCAVDDTVRFESQDRLKTRFSVEAFAFLGHFTSDSIFVHCDIEARDVGSAQECELVAANSSKRRRRRHACRDGSSTGLSTGVVNSEGPIRIIRSTPDSDFTAVKENVPSITHQSPFVPAFIFVTSIILCILLVALVVAMATVVRNLKIENRRLAKFVGSPNPIPLTSITDP